MNRPVLALTLALLWPAVATGQTRLPPGEAPRGSPSDVQSLPGSPTLSRDRPSETSPQPSREAQPGGRPSGGSQPARSSPGPSPTPSTSPTPADSPTPPDNGSAPMRFQWVREGPQESCGKNCRGWVVASGRITPDTARDFQAFARERDVRGAVVVIESHGGTVLSGLELGRAFRRLEMTTTVGKTTLLPTSDGETRATLSPRAACASMCAFALLGGVRRHVPPEARVLVHQIWPSSKRDDAAAQSYTAENMVALQRSLGVLARFIVEMGGDIELFELAMRIPPWERMRSLTADELHRLKMRTVDNPFEGVLTAGAPVNTVPPVVAPTPATLPVGNAWAITERSGLRGLARRHSLTIEGDEIGSFEIMFSCGESPDAYALHYTEKRRQPDARDRLTKVVVVSGRERATLTVESSAKIDTDLESAARGAMPSTLLSAFADSAQNSIVVATETSNNVRTLIKVGNTGFGAALPQLAATCRR